MIGLVVMDVLRAGITYGEFSPPTFYPQDVHDNEPYHLTVPRDNFIFTETVLSLLSIQVWISTRISRNLVTGKSIMAEKSLLLELTSVVDEGPCLRNFD